MIRKITVVLILVNILAIHFLFAQNHDNSTQLFLYAKKLENDGKLNDALTIYKNLLKSDSSNIQYLTNTSILYSRVGFRQKTEDQKKSWYQTALYLGKKAVTLNNQSADAHYSYAIAIGRLSEFASNKTKINNAKQIKIEAEEAIKLNPKLAGPFHILGRWHKEIAGFNAIERTMINAIFGGIPGGSYTDAISNFQKAILLEPTNPVHYYELAATYIMRNDEGDKAQAKNWASKCLLIKPKTEDDEDNLQNCRDILKKLEK